MEDGGVLAAPTAIIATSDELPIGALDAARARRLEVPDELSVTGLDDTAAAPDARPPLTTVRQDHHDKGHRACGQLLDRLCVPAQ
jgi:LacI family transcriptional regulator